jgi:26S proteasome regulatory subunit N2
MSQLLRGQGSFLGDPQTPGGNLEMGAGAAAAAGVLTAVDEDEEGAEEAQMPGEFEYFTEGEDGDD